MDILIRLQVQMIISLLLSTFTTFYEFRFRFYRFQILEWASAWGKNVSQNIKFWEEYRKSFHHFYLLETFSMCTTNVNVSQQSNFGKTTAKVFTIFTYLKHSPCVQSMSMCLRISNFGKNTEKVFTTLPAWNILRVYNHAFFSSL